MLRTMLDTLRTVVVLPYVFLWRATFNREAGSL